MKGVFTRIFALLCVLMLLFAPLSLAASGAGGGTPLVVKPTTAETANFMLLTNREGTLSPPYYSSSGWFYDTNFIVLEGYKTALGVGSMDDAWDFTLYINSLYNRSALPPGTAPTTTRSRPVIVHEIVNGTEKSVLVNYIGENPDPLDKAEAKKASLEEIRKMAGMPKNEALGETAAATVPFPQTAYTAEFTIRGNGHLGPDTQKGSITTTVGGVMSFTNEDDQAPRFTGTLSYHVTLTIDNMDYATAVVRFTDCNGVSHSWTLEGYMGVAEKIKPKRPPVPPTPPDDDDLKPVGWDDPPGTKPKPPEDDDLAPVDPDPRDTKPKPESPYNPNWYDPNHPDYDPLAPVR